MEERILQLQEKKRLVFDGTVGRLVRGLIVFFISWLVLVLIPVLLNPGMQAL